MKNLYFLFAIVFLITSCSTSEDSPSYASNDTLSSQMYKINKKEAASIANRVLKHSNTTRSIDNSTNSPKFEYVLNNNITRASSNLPDTLAYVINYPNNGGFVIVSSDNRVYPVLAYSDEGNFSFENEIAKNNFINGIGTYLDKSIQTSETSTYTVSNDDFDACYSFPPQVQISLHQNAPYTKYIAKEHPGCPAGCVAVATALIMTHSNWTLTYHDLACVSPSITKAIAKGPNATQTNSMKRIVGDYEPVYTYEQAVDYMSKLLYWIGKDVNMIYNPNGSSAVSEDAYNLLKGLGYSIPSGYASFDIKDVTSYLRNNHIIYLRGRDWSKGAGHAWVSDGCSFCVDPFDKSIIKDTYIHCNWGWGGSCNGYYSGSVFAASSYQFEPINYFAVKTYLR